jgi:Acyl-coenzyme A synthetases/AMP-(fatty) acid ligases
MQKFISKKYSQKFHQNNKRLLKWSINNSDFFWSTIWDFCKVKGDKGKQKLKKSNTFYKNVFLPNSRLSFAENLLFKNDHSKALTFISENGFREERSWKQLRTNVSKLIFFFKKVKINEKDRVAAYMPNINETVECFLSTSAIGAISSSCSPDFGTNGVIERFSQIKP